MSNSAFCAPLGNLRFQVGGASGLDRSGQRVPYKLLDGLL